ncbi:uncharacterized protein M421DRAFT_424044 [Didymella exigua CBS 183.55]|uniref:Uncharacterized protein n=1 Tax=Didymella exigua CBS 183.55 TaxID=1150837 RepID=A0A6A5RC33_9PLEO|nr:uncharacterized protein M421DRAFT_424044 [Didymella exigua CBS 183.55]KAF1925242.1 hypothetical protein M421DRAFT_424044 [Didymella exigua CBS 183.55]
MPVFHTPHASMGSGASYSDAASRFSGRQVMDADNHGTRKRRNGDYDTFSIRGFIAQPRTGTSSAFSHFESPAPLAHDRYTLAGGSIEGTNSFTRQNGNYDDYFNLQTQRGMWSSPTSPSMRPMTLDRVASTPDTPSSWMVDSLFNLVGGVAGTLFKFCTVPFRGFQAGGGQSYDADAQIKIASKLGLHDEPEPSEPAAPVQQIKFDTRPSPSDDYGVRSIESVDADRPRMPKRLRTEDAWVMVGTDEETTASPVITPRISERRMPAPAYTPSPSQIPRPLSRTSAIPVSKRPSLIPISRRSSGTRTPLYNSSISGSKSHNRQRSFSRLSFGSPGKAEEKKKASPLPPDSQKLVSRIRREEMEDDARMRRMSSQMSAMLREAREALGSTVEINDDDDDDVMS